jgi:glycosyltransferase involved in cell wall biosynthesis
MQERNNQMTDGLVSVIINVYNCKQYLPTSLESVRQQTYKNLEVILVDDASTDGSGELCDEFCTQDERFRVIHHVQNTGVSGPRNTGLKNAHGEYIYFLDGDDYIHVEAIEALVDAINETGLELAAFDLYKGAGMNGDIHRLREKKPLELVPSDQMIFEMLAWEGVLRWRVVWNKLYKSTLIEGLFLNDYYSIQDQDFNIRVYQRIEYAVLVPEQLYWYVSNPNSLQRTSSYNVKRFYFNTMYNFRMLANILPGKNENKYRGWIIYYGYIKMLERRDKEKGTDYEDSYKKLGKSIIQKTRWDFLHIREIPIRKKARFFFSWYLPQTYKFYSNIKNHGTN